MARLSSALFVAALLAWAGCSLAATADQDLTGVYLLLAALLLLARRRRQRKLPKQ